MLSQERQFSVNGYELAAVEWNQHSKNKIIALHGWLDNAASFDTLSPLLPDHHIIALDLSGHGKSDHKGEQATYNIWDDLLDILAVADQLQWDTFSLLGHSRGAIISLILSAASPERVDALVLLDGILPQSVDIKNTAKQLARFIADNRALPQKRPPSYHSIEQAIDARVKAASMDSSSARMIVERGLKKTEGEQYTWRADPRLMTASAFKMSDGHNHALIEAVNAPMLLLLAKQGLGANPGVLGVLEQYPQITNKLLTGSHHFHMEKEAGEIAIRIQDFLKTVVIGGDN